MWFRTAIRAFQESAPHNKQSTLSILKGLIVDLFEYQKGLTAEDVKFIYSLMRIAKISKSELANTIMNAKNIDDLQRPMYINLLKLR